MSVTLVNVDVDRIYELWRLHLLENSKAKYFGMVYDPTQTAKFPYGNFRLIGRSTSGGDLQGDESSITLTFETEAYINTNKYLTLYEIDNASADFFINLGFRRVGNSELLKVSDTVTKIQSRFIFYNFCGYFLKDISNT